MNKNFFQRLRNIPVFLKRKTGCYVNLLFIKKVVLRIALLSFGLFLALFFLELILRIPIFETLTTLETTAMRYNPYYREAYKPYYQLKAASPESPSWNVNSLGFKDIDFRLEKEKDIVRLAFIGDSFTFGYKVEIGERFSEIAQKKLNEHSQKGERYESLNFGFPGWGTGEYEAVYEHLVRKYSPAYLLIGYFFGNDHLDAIYHDYLKRYYFFRGLPDTYIPASLHHFFKKHSCFYRFLFNRYYNLVERTNPDVKQILFEGDIEGRMLYETQVEPERNLEIMRSWDIVRQNISNIKKLADQDKTKVILIIIPGQENVIPDFWKKKKAEGHNLDERIYTNPKSYQFIVDIAKELEIEYIDILEKIKNNPQVEKMYFVEDFHFSSLGHQVVGEAIYEKITNH